MDEKYENKRSCPNWCIATHLTIHPEEIHGKPRCHGQNSNRALCQRRIVATAWTSFLAGWGRHIHVPHEHLTWHWQSAATCITLRTCWHCHSSCEPSELQSNKCRERNAIWNTFTHRAPVCLRHQHLPSIRHFLNYSRSRSLDTDVASVPYFIYIIAAPNCF
jgi:hypothetical protein